MSDWQVPAKVMARFDAKYEVSVDGCWLWVAYIDSGGYGLFSHNGRPVKAHRFSYEAHVGQIPQGLQIDHLCRVRHCVNPAHLEPVTHAENIRRGVANDMLLLRQASITHCPQGHEYTQENTRLGKTRSGSNCRHCKECAKIRARNIRAKERELRNV